MHTQPLVEVQNVAISYRDKKILDNCSLTLHAGEVVALLGKNGAGKTTLIHTMLGLKKPDSGTVRLAGYAPGTQEARNLTGVMLQDVTLPEVLTARELLWMFQAQYAQPLEIEYLLEITQLTEYQHVQSGRLSGGQKQRLSFALAYMGDPPILFLDEPTNGMDIGSKQAFWQLIGELKTKGKTILLTTHQMEEIGQMGDRVLLLAKDYIQFEGRITDLLNTKKQLIFSLRDINDWSRFSLQYPIATIKEGRVYLETNQSEDAIRFLVKEDIIFYDLDIEKDNMSDVLNGLVLNYESRGE